MIKKFVTHPCLKKQLCTERRPWWCSPRPRWSACRTGWGWSCRPRSRRRRSRPWRPRSRGTAPAPQHSNKGNLRSTACWHSTAQLLKYQSSIIKDNFQFQNPNYWILNTRSWYSEVQFFGLEGLDNGPYTLSNKYMRQANRKYKIKGSWISRNLSLLYHCFDIIYGPPFIISISKSFYMNYMLLFL